jgi:magnesium transporter
VNPSADSILDQPVTQFLRFDYCRLRADQTVDEALADLRIQQPEGRIIYFYVVDDEDRLLGVVPTRRLLLSPPQTPIRQIMVPQVVTLPATATVRDACQRFLEHRFLAFPVVHQGRMLGLVDVDLFASGIDDLERTKEQEDLFQLLGVHLTAAEQASATISFLRRFPWLLCNIAGGVLAAILSAWFEGLLARVVALALFVPVVLALSESVAIQSVSLALALLHGQPPTLAGLLARLRSEATTGLLLGAACGALVSLVAFGWMRDARLALTLWGGMGLGITGSAIFGLAMPYALRLLQRDPKVAAGPVALVFADMLTLAIYFSLAQALLG